jgi:hypothetical protein
MAKVTYQNQDGALDNVAHFGCMCASIYNYKSLFMGIDTSIQELNDIWNKAIAAGIIDGNKLDSTYLEVESPQGLIDLIGLPLQYVDRHITNINEPIPPNTYVLNEYFRQSNGFHHFCSGGLDGVLLFDPIYSWDGSKNIGSQTVMHGVLLERRFYTIVG